MIENVPPLQGSGIRDQGSGIRDQESEDGYRRLCRRGKVGARGFASHWYFAPSLRGTGE
ncbi:MAG: hypothetical protein LBI62_08290 [Candidatus Accumulibacter sp.]|nr:hypothetical protein [Accumulibacter sp.]